ncbi:HNH endonuclease [Kaistia adipata]|uniref:HNH endonuclease n=1 Tax=Kaistia adipata TaxID=166954 RepID=UPI001AEC0A49|nr:HNH endonuclease [Kaistia adipata]
MLFTEFDRPVFKILPKNDTGGASGHQAGFLVPRDLKNYFPVMPPTSAAKPAVYREISAALFVNDSSLGVVRTNYQHQTWAGTRTAERRVTGGLATWLAQANKGDVLLIEQSLTDELFYRFTICKAGSAAHARIASQIGSRRWGVLLTSDPPVAAVDEAHAATEQAAHEAAPFLDLFDNDAVLTETRVRRIARARVFQRRVSEVYGGRCAVCGGGLHTSHGKSEVEAAHIVPRSLKGADDIRNGLALCRTHHWAFDNGLFGIKDGLVYLPSVVASRPENADLVAFSGKKLRAPTHGAAAPAQAALEWHFREIVIRW